MNCLDLITPPKMFLRSNIKISIYCISKCKITKLRPQLKKIIYWEFPGGLVVRVRHFHGCGLASIPP